MWFRVDDRFWQHPKLDRIPKAKRNECAGLWVRAGSWCAMNLTDGHIPNNLPTEKLDAKPATIVALEFATFWIPEPDGWLMHDWEAWQPTREYIESRREFDRKRKRRPDDDTTT